MTTNIVHISCELFLKKKLNMTTVKTSYKSSNMEGFPYCKTSLFVSLAAQSATDELIPPAPEKDS